MNANVPGAALPLIAALLQLEKMVLEASTLTETRFVIANATRTLSPYTQAVLLVGATDQPLRVSCLSNVSEVDRTAPFVAWAERLADHVATQDTSQGVRTLTPESLTPTLRREWAEFAQAYLLWVPLSLRPQQRQGALLLSRESAWTPQEMTLLTHLSLVYAHALDRFQPRLRTAWLQRRPATVAAVAMAALAIVSLIPIRLSVLAPAEIVANAPTMVSAPIDGVVRQIHVLPNQVVNQDAVLAELEAGDLRGIQDVAAKALDVAQAELRRAEQASLLDPARKADLAPLQAQVDLKSRELQLARSRVVKTVLRAEREGVVVVDDPQSWSGRPVRVGEPILRIADPSRIEVTIWVPIKDAVAVAPGHEVRVFLDTDPLRSHRGSVRYVVYESTLAGEWPAYKVTARLEEPTAAPRIGLRGTARIYGEKTTLFYYVFRRPITAARQWLGW